MISDPARYQETIALFDAANAADPHREAADGQVFPKALLYSMRMTEMLERYAPAADEVVQLAVRAQHIQRWLSPRNSYPMDRQGYLQWRTALYKFHAATAGRLMQQAGYDEALMVRVMAAIGKKGIKVNPDAQLVEDVSGLVFLEHYMTGFAADQPDYSEEKWLNIIRKTWLKMSEPARAFALAGKVRLPGHLLPLILKAVENPANTNT